MFLPKSQQTIPLRLLSSFKANKWVKPTGPNILSSSVDFQPTSKISIPEFLKTNLHKWENATAFECAVTGRKYTHGEVHKKSDSFAASLKNHHGIQKRDAVCVLLPNVPEYPIALLGTWNAGLVASTINPSYTAGEVTSQVNDCKGKVIITIPQLLPLVEKVKEACPSLKSVIVVGGEPQKGCHSFFEMLKTDPSGAHFLQGSQINTLKETVLLPYSSGTTGPPKGVEITHSTFSTNLLQITHPGYKLTEFFERGTEQDRVIALLPFFHMYGLHIIMGNAMHQGSHVLCFPKFEPEMFIQGVRRHKPTVLHLVTPLIAFITQSKDITPQDLSATRGTIAGAAPIGKTLLEQYLNKFGRYTLFQEGYGMTELSCVSHITPPETKNSKAGSSGTLVPGTTMKIVDLDSGKPLGPNEKGEICVRGPQVMKGYLNNEEATRDTFDDDGFLKTGDIGYNDEDGFLHIVDRLKELIKVKGLQVAPAELENLLRQHPQVSDVAIIGVPHERLGETPRAYIVPKKSSQLTEKSITDFLHPQVSAHKRLEGGVKFVDAIPKAASGKILRRVLREGFREEML